MDSLDLGVLSVVASFGYPEELVGLGLALGKDRGAELLGLTATVDAILRRPLRVSNWGSINATELVTPMPFTFAECT